VGQRTHRSARPAQSYHWHSPGISEFGFVKCRVQTEVHWPLRQKRRSATWLEQGRNPILLVRQSAKRQRIPEWLEPEELSALLSRLDRCFRVMVLDPATGLRRSELLALKWGDIEFESQQIKVQRSIYRNVVSNCKKEASKKPVPMDPILAAELWAWKQHSSYRSGAAARRRGVGGQCSVNILNHYQRGRRTRREPKHSFQIGVIRLLLEQPE
jgi:integrase